MQKRTRSLLEALNDVVGKKDSESIIESRATHVIDAAINLLNLIKETYDPETAYELERRLVNSIKGSDSAKFVRSIRKLRDLKETAKTLKIVKGEIEP